MLKPAQGPITQRYHSAHQALDMGGRAYFNTPVVAPHDGTVVETGQMGSGTLDAGLVVGISGGRYKSRLCHLNKISITAGKTVKAGTIIGYQGYTGYTRPDNTIDGTHCHWVLWKDGVRVNPEPYITSNPTPPVGGGKIMDTDAKVRAQYYTLRGNEGTAAERKGWLGKSYESFNAKARPEAANHAKDKAAIAARDKTIAAQKAQLTAKDKEIATLKAQLAAGGGGGDFIPAGQLYIKK